VKLRSRSRRLWTSLFALALIGSACGGAAATGPPEINYGRDICTECNMIISEARFASAYRLADGTEKVFDDVGGMVIHGRDSGELPDAAAWVHDFETEEWVEATVAFYVPTRAVASPMGHGILAFADQARAEAFAGDLGGEVIDWTTVLALPVVDGLVGPPGGDGDG
jgi:copper chaperone NosL